MIKFKKEYQNSILNLPGKIQIHRHNVSQYEKVMKESFPDMIEEFNADEEHSLSPKKASKKEASSNPADTNG